MWLFPYFFFFLPLNNALMFLKKIPLYLLSGWMTCDKVSITLPTSPSSPHLSAVPHRALRSIDLHPRTQPSVLPLPVNNQGWPSLLYTIPFLFSCKKRQPLIVYETHENTTLHKIPIWAPTFCIEMHGFQGSNERISQAQALRHDEVQVAWRHYFFLNRRKGVTHGWVLRKELFLPLLLS